MPKTIKILQNGSEKNLSKVAKIRTMLATGENCDWIPEADVPLGILIVTQDGVYDPSQDPNGPFYGYSMVTVDGVGNTEMGQLAEITITKNGTYDVTKDEDGSFYGYSKVIVNVKKKSDDDDGDGGSSKPVTGKDPDGDDAIAGVDEDGNIYTQKLPTRISINIYPNNLVYEDGQTIDFTGLRVKAFLPDGTEWGFVPDGELIKPVKVAEGDGESLPDTYTPSDDITLPNDMSSLVGSSEAYAYASNSRDWFHMIASGGRSAVIEYGINSNSPTVLIVCASESSGITARREWAYANDPNVDPRGISGWTVSGQSQVLQTTINGKTFYYTVENLWHYQTDRQYNIDIPNSTESAVSAETLAYILLYGNYNQGGNQQTIPLQWKRPGDSKVLETSFSIAVHGS